MTVTAAALPTLLSAQGMIGVGTDILGLHIAVAFALATFLELALIASGLLSRVSALEGRPGGADVVATWAVSFVSGCFSATHELIAPATTNARPDSPFQPSATQWQDDPASLLAAAVRFAAPLVAAWLWHRVLTRDRRTAEDRSLAEIRRTRRLLALASSARVVRRLEEREASPRRLTRARRRMDRQHAKVLRLVPATDPTLAGDINWALGCLADGDNFPALTRSITPSAAAALRQADGVGTATMRTAEPAVGHAAPPGPSNHQSTSRTFKRTEPDTAGPEADEDGGPDNDGPDDDGPDGDGPDGGPGRGTRAQSKERLSQAVKILEAQPDITGPQMAQLMAERGHRMTDRTGLRWVERAQVEIAHTRRRLSVVRA